MITEVLKFLGLLFLMFIISLIPVIGGYINAIIVLVALYEFANR